MMNTEKRSCEDIQKLMKALIGFCPELTFEEPLKEADHEIADALAVAYGERGYRKYLENSINKAKDNAAMTPGNLYQAMFARGRIEAFIEMYATGREAFARTLKKAKYEQSAYEIEQNKIYSPGSGERVKEESAKDPSEDSSEGRASDG